MSKHKRNRRNIRRPSIGKALRKFIDRRDGAIRTPEVKYVCKTIQGQNKALIFKSELDYISRCILDCPNIETGGQLFGYWTEDGVPVVLYAIGPGRHANHQVTFFNQDVEYLETVGHKIYSVLGLHHIGEWHSHHQLGLSHPSSHDEHTMVTNIRKEHLEHFILCIGNCNSQGSVLHPYYCNETACFPIQWEIIFNDSPVRSIADRMFANILVNPRTSEPKHQDSRLNGSPLFNRGYWLEEKGNGRILKQIQEYVSGILGPSNLELDDDSLVHITTRRTQNGAKIDILFPRNFPQESPVWSIGSSVMNGHWNYRGDIFASFKEYLHNIINH